MTNIQLSAKSLSFRCTCDQRRLNTDRAGLAVMEETQAIDFDDLPSEEEPVQADIHQVCFTCVELLVLKAAGQACQGESNRDELQVAGELQTVSEPAHRLPLYLGELRFVTA